MVALRVCQRLHAEFSTAAAAAAAAAGPGLQPGPGPQADVGKFGEALTGALAPAQLIQRPVLGVYLAHLRSAAAGRACQIVACRVIGCHLTQ